MRAHRTALRPAGAARTAAAPVPDRVQHFACHCYAAPDRPLGAEIELAGPGGPLTVDLGDLGTEMALLAMAHRPRPAALPLVFLNACGSSRLDVLSGISFRDFFLDQDNRGFIGTRAL